MTEKHRVTFLLSMANQYPHLAVIDGFTPDEFITPAKKIHDEADVSFFLTSLAYRDVMTFVLQLNHSMVPRKLGNGNHHQTWEIGSKDMQFSQPVLRLRDLMLKLEAFIAEVPPDTGPRRFGNISFRRWYGIVNDRIKDLLMEHIPPAILREGSSTPELNAIDEIKMYLLGSFGSPQRLDYGTGHELSFLAFLGCVWKLGGFANVDPGLEERGIVLGVFQPYLNLVRNLITTYNLEPAGSHGVWGLDDNSFLPYIFGSAQLAPAISQGDETPVEGSITGAPDPSDVTKQDVVESERSRNMYFSAVGFITDVKRGPFWEHSPMLFDISGIRTGWGKINKGMIKMYNAEVLSKFPVVQHFLFGSLFRWEKDPSAVAVSMTSNTSSRALRKPLDAGSPAAPIPSVMSGTAAPWASSLADHPSGRRPQPPVGTVGSVAAAPWTGPTLGPTSSGGFGTRPFATQLNTMSTESEQSTTQKGSATN